ncbi:MAG: ArsR/SmtB family transcription factor, partial [Candidatus Sericytochromatia bacterium]
KKRAAGCCVINKAFTRACERFALSRSTLSHHFKELQNAGLIHCERKGQSFECQVNPEAVELVRRFLK